MKTTVVGEFDSKGLKVRRAMRLVSTRALVCDNWGIWFWAQQNKGRVDSCAGGVGTMTKLKLEVVIHAVRFGC